MRSLTSQPVTPKGRPAGPGRAPRAPRHPASRGRGWLVIGLLLLITTGCGEDPVVRSPGPRPSPPVAQHPVPSSSVGKLDMPDPLGDTPDPLASGAVGPGASSAPDLGGASDPSAGPKMPTEHSHWLRGRIFNARVTVLLNGMRLGEFAAPVDKDITMKCRKGVNTVVFIYEPLTSTSSADLDILESEHDPPIAPLATFRSPMPAAEGLSGASRPQKITGPPLTFIAN